MKIKSLKLNAITKFGLIALFVVAISLCCCLCDTSKAFACDDDPCGDYGKLVGYKRTENVTTTVTKTTTTTEEWTYNKSWTTGWGKGSQTSYDNSKNCKTDSFDKKKTGNCGGYYGPMPTQQKSGKKGSGNTGGHSNSCPVFNGFYK